MFNRFLSYKTEIKTRFSYNENETDQVNQLLIKFISRELHTKSILNEDGNVYFETDFWRRKVFHPEVAIFCFTIDAGQIVLIKNDGQFGLKIEVSFLRLLVLFYAISFLVLLVGVVYTDWKLISLITLIPLCSPVLIIYPLSILGARIFVSKLEKLK